MTPPSFWPEKDAFYSFLESMEETVITNVTHCITYTYESPHRPGFQKTKRPPPLLANYRISQDKIYILTK